MSTKDNGKGADISAIADAIAVQAHRADGHALTRSAMATIIIAVGRAASGTDQLRSGRRNIDTRVIRRSAESARAAAP